MTATTQVALGEVASIIRKAVDPGEIATGTPYVGLDNIVPQGGLNGVTKVAAGDLESTKFAFTRRDVLFGKLRPYLAKIARPDFGGVCSTDILPIRPGAALDRDYLAHYLALPLTVSLASQRAAGANLPRLSPKELERFRLPLPPLNEQRRIARVLDAADGLRTKRRCVLKHLAALLESTFTSMFGDPTRPGTRWTRLALRDVTAEIRIGPFGTALHRSDYVEGGVPVINPMHIRAGGIRPDPRYAVSLAKHAELASHHLQQGDVILGRRGEMGRCAVVQHEHAGMICGTGSIVLRPAPKIAEPIFLQALLSSPGARESLAALSSGVTMANLNRSQVGDLRVGVPPLVLQTMYSVLTGKVRTLRRTGHASAAHLETLFASLQHRAFAGEL